MIIGFTGTRVGMRVPQLQSLKYVLSMHEESTFHHGDCKGADAEAHDVAKFFEYFIIVHPPEDPKLRAYCEGNVIRATKPYIQRNHNIVDESDILLATPRTFLEERQGSGTWATIRYAFQMAKRVVIIRPDGTLGGGGL